MSFSLHIHYCHEEDSVPVALFSGHLLLGCEDQLSLIQVLASVLSLQSHRLWHLPLLVSVLSPILLPRFVVASWSPSGILFHAINHYIHMHMIGGFLYQTVSRLRLL